MSEAEKDQASLAGPTAGVPADRKRTRALRIAWAVTIAEGLLWLGCLIVFRIYWLMLPVKYRWYGIVGLAVSGAIGILRIVLFYRKWNRQRSSSRPGLK